MKTDSVVVKLTNGKYFRLRGIIDCGDRENEKYRYCTLRI
jgi:hypothetical protein